ncbi:hypothetical protein FRC05_008711 [Tulasnella sp. 425]|nr:hypothetical protein FRC05_008711 [Tulasnella sp. 425]
MVSSTEDIRMPSTSSSAQYYDPPPPTGVQRRSGGHTRGKSSSWRLPGSPPTIASGVSQTIPLISLARPHSRDTTYTTLVTQPTDEEYRRAYTYPNETLQPHFSRKHVTLIAISE